MTIKLNMTQVHLLKYEHLIELCGSMSCSSCMNMIPLHTLALNSYGSISVSVISYIYHLKLVSYISITYYSTCEWMK